MKYRSKAVFSTFVGACLLTTMLSACGARAPQTPKGQQQIQKMQQQGQNLKQNLDRANLPGTAQRLGQGDMLGVNPGTNRLNQLTPQQQRTADIQKANNIKTQLKNTMGIKNAYVVSMGNTVLVGIKSSGTKKQTAETRNMIIKNVKAVDSGIANVKVSDSPSILLRTNRLENDINNNKPANETANEFNRIIHTINTGS